MSAKSQTYTAHSDEERGLQRKGDVLMFSTVIHRAAAVRKTRIVTVLKVNEGSAFNDLHTDVE